MTIKERACGIVLKILDRHNKKVVLFDEKRGKIIAFTFQGALCHGALFSYSVLPRPMYFLISDIEMLQIVHPGNLSDMLFLHHVLELYDHFIPVGIASTCLFDYLTHLHTVLHRKKCSNTFKLLFLFKLFARLGIYPEDRRFHMPYFYQLAYKPIQSITEEQLTVKTYNVLCLWFRECITLYELANLKTVHFLTALGES